MKKKKQTCRTAKNDPGGSYTGNSEWGAPEQDADDL